MAKYYFIVLNSGFEIAGFYVQENSDLVVLKTDKGGTAIKQDQIAAVTIVDKEESD